MSDTVRRTFLIAGTVSDDPPPVPKIQRIPPPIIAVLGHDHQIACLCVCVLLNMSLYCFISYTTSKFERNLCNIHYYSSLPPPSSKPTPPRMHTLAIPTRSFGFNKIEAYKLINHIYSINPLCNY